MLGLRRRCLGLRRRCLSLRHLRSYGAEHVLDRDRLQPRGRVEVQHFEIVEPKLVAGGAEEICIQNSGLRHEDNKKVAATVRACIWASSPAWTIGSEGSPEGWAERDGPAASPTWKPAFKPHRIHVNNGISKQT
jgi:hypothetical protein